ncbi:CAP1 [Candida oxycetoniae]|uniref:F-actin-capping protein subunit alpha n=1 Tax=Candida oxycetoniae TaxID=497107 RepID=A0AAI9SWV5_9ASCO|nr:CAP1 [Candida oxycetoniae]KAI3404025.1 CAP1 [Candida oxycetoniae]
MSVKLQDLVNSLIQSAPSTELSKVVENLRVISNASKSTLEDAITQYINGHPIAISSYIISKYNKDPVSSKYIDFVRGQKFNFDVVANDIIDVESYDDGASIDKKLASKLGQYGTDCYQDFSFTIIPESQDDAMRIIIIGQKQNQSNFYTGVWKSEYYVKDSQITGEIALDIHYFEDGNVRLKYSNDDISGTVTDESSIVNFINKQETKIETKLVDQFQMLNQQSFKKLRRLLPITRSKINWGNAIGNYRLGSDVVKK